jgi:hypothetical protein
MEEVENSSAIQEIVPPETETHVATAEIPVETPKVVEEDRQERNWRRMSQKQNELEQKLKDKEQMLEKFMLAQMSASAPKEVDELDKISDDEFIPKGQVHKLIRKEAQKIASEIAKEENEKFLKNQRESQFKDTLKRQFSDFDEIVNPDTLAILDQQDPELARTISDLGDPYKIGLQCYKYIKAMNLSAKVPESRRAKEVEKKLEQNAKTVQTPQAYEKRPMAQAFKMTDSEKNKLYEEMNACARLAGSVPEMH